MNAGGIVLGQKLGTPQATGNLNITGGTATLTGDITDGGGSSTVNLNGGSLNMSSHNIGSATQSIDTLTLAAGTLSNVNQINNGANVTKSTAGTLTVLGTNTYTGLTTVAAGKLVVGGSLSGNVTVNNGATVATLHNAVGTIGSLNVNDLAGGGIVAPGDTGGATDTSTVGQLNVTGNVVLGNASAPTQAHLAMELGGTTPGSLYDQLKLTGAGSTLNLAKVDLDLSTVNSSVFDPASLTIATSDNAGGFATPGTEFFLVVGSTQPVVGTFQNQGALDVTFSNYHTFFAGGQAFAISYTANFNGGVGSTFSGGNDVAIMAIPEPNSLSMLAGSFGLALGLQRFRRRRK
ncbi:MAG: hypothetical protein WDN28_29230 [Chthoniobacter sp.]